MPILWAHEHKPPGHLRQAIWRCLQVSGVYKLLSGRSQQAVGRPRESKDGSHQPLLCESRSSSCVAAGSLTLGSRLQAEQMGLPHRKTGLCYCSQSVQCPGVVACQELSFQLLQSSETQERKPPWSTKPGGQGHPLLCSPKTLGTRRLKPPLPELLAPWSVEMAPTSWNLEWGRGSVYRWRPRKKEDKKKEEKKNSY